MIQQRWVSSNIKHPENRRAVKEHRGKYMEEVITEIYHWRNKIAAHFAITDPYGARCY